MTQSCCCLLQELQQLQVQRNDCIMAFYYQKNAVVWHITKAGY